MSWFKQPKTIETNLQSDKIRLINSLQQRGPHTKELWGVSHQKGKEPVTGFGGRTEFR